MSKGKLLFFIIFFSFQTTIFCADWQKVAVCQLALLTDSLKLPIADSSKHKIADFMQSQLTVYLNDSVSFFNDELKTVKNLGCIVSPDSSFRLISWNFFTSAGKSFSFTILQKRPTSNICNVLIIKQKEEYTKKGVTFPVDQISSALYYQIIPTIASGKTTYLLLGMDPGDMFVQSKRIETMSFSKSGDPVFGIPIIHINNTFKRRLEFFYASNVRMSLKYDEQNKLVLIDHLSPTKPFFTGKYEFYGPDGSYDALIYKDKEWLFVSDYNLLKKGGRNK